LQPKIWLKKQQTLDISIDDLNPSSYFLVNIERMGYYRVQYDESNWMLISNELSRMDPSSNISPISRAMLMNDAAIFLTRNMLRARIFLELMKHLEHDVRMKEKNKFYCANGSSCTIMFSNEKNRYYFLISLLI
jgi:aminopeptidase N